MLKDQSIIKEMALELEKKPFSRHELQNEVVAARRVKIAEIDKIGVISGPLVSSKDDLEVYRKRAHERVDSLQDGIENVVATITFKEPQPESRIENLISKHHLQGFGVKIQGSHDFIVMARYPIDKEYLKDARKGILEEYNRTKELASTQDLEKRQVLEQALPEKFVETFEINKGFFALYCVGMSNDLVKCKDEKEIYTVDVGPIEVRDALLELETDLPSEIIVTPPGDLAYYVKTYLN